MVAGSEGLCAEADVEGIDGGVGEGGGGEWWEEGEAGDQSGGFRDGCEGWWSGQFVHAGGGGLQLGEELG
ncbi:MAG: hypothetical protein ACO34E_11315 [Limisphaerales bacterium]